MVLRSQSLTIKKLRLNYPGKSIPTPSSKSVSHNTFTPYPHQPIERTSLPAATMGVFQGWRPLRVKTSLFVLGQSKLCFWGLSRLNSCMVVVCLEGNIYKLFIYKIYIYIYIFIKLTKFTYYTHGCSMHHWRQMSFSKTKIWAIMCNGRVGVTSMYGWLEEEVLFSDKMIINNSMVWEFMLFYSLVRSKIKTKGYSNYNQTWRAVSMPHLSLPIIHMQTIIFWSFVVYYGL